jgi:hypothetical protein
MATREKPHTSRSPAAWRLGAVDERAENAGRSSIQNSTSLQHPKTAGRLLTAFAPIAGIDYFWHFTAFLPKSTRRLLSCSARKGAHVFGSTLLISRAMAKRKKQRTKQRFASAYERYQKIALDEARRVAWPQLMQFVDESLRWEVFNLWIRAVVNAANGIPQVIEQELESRIPGFLARVRADLKSSASHQDPVGELLWNLVGAWIATNVLLQPKVEGWLNALNFYSSRTMTHMKA